MNINIYYSMVSKPFLGPFNHETTLLFWEMVWQSNCSKIIMLTNTREQHRVSSSSFATRKPKLVFFVNEMTKVDQKKGINIPLYIINVSKQTKERLISYTIVT